jgi:hypothetical protein
MKWGRMEDYLVEMGGRKGYIMERNGRSSWERQRIVTFCELNIILSQYIFIIHTANVGYKIYLSALVCLCVCLPVCLLVGQCVHVATQAKFQLKNGINEWMNGEDVLVRIYSR